MIAQCAHPGCIFVLGHGGDHFVPEDGLDHSNEIRIRVMRDSLEKARLELDRKLGKEQACANLAENQLAEARESSRHYISTACYHGDHANCVGSCKWCGGPCRHEWHQQLGHEVKPRMTYAGLERLASEYMRLLDRAKEANLQLEELIEGKL